MISLRKHQNDVSDPNVKLSHAVSNLLEVSSYGFVNLKLIFQNTRRFKSFSPTKIVSADLKNPRLCTKRVARIAMTFTLIKRNVVYMTGKRIITEPLPETFALPLLRITQHQVVTTGHNIKWDHFEVLAKVFFFRRCKIKETLLIRELKPTLNEIFGSEELWLY